MNNIVYKTFFELIQVSLGMRFCLSHTPSADEWDKIYCMVKKQSLVGVCFAGIQNLVSQQQAPTSIGSAQAGNLYRDWMGMTAKIQHRNEVVNLQCVELQKRLSIDGMQSCVLKGQGVAQLYDNNLCMLRQSGDIDVWVDASKEIVVAWVEQFGMIENPNYLHVGARVFLDTEVELHYRPTYMRSLIHNKRLQRFCEIHKDDWTKRNQIIVPSWNFDVVYQLSHIYRHLFGLGIGLRQLMDYYFVLKSFHMSCYDYDHLQNILKHLGLYDFAGAVMYLMKEVFLLEEQYMIVPVDNRRGKALLRDVMSIGNFGHMDEKQREARKTMTGGLWWKLKRDMELVRFYPAETLSEPIWKIYSLIKK